MAPTTRIGELERAVMDRLWALEEGRWATVRDVHEALAAERGSAYTTVMTVLDRLAKKRLVRRQRDGRAYRYRPAASRAELTAGLVREALEELSEDRRAGLVAFVGQASEEERAALREALARLEGA